VARLQGVDYLPGTHLAPARAKGMAMANNQRHQAERRPVGKVGGQGMGQGRGMNPGEVHHSGTNQKGGDRSDRAAVSGATGEKSTSGGQNKPHPKDQDEKGMGHPRNK